MLILLQSSKFILQLVYSLSILVHLNVLNCWVFHRRSSLYEIQNRFIQQSSEKTIQTLKGYALYKLAHLGLVYLFKLREPRLHICSPSEFFYCCDY